MARWLKVFLFALGVAGLVLATLPWWLGTVLRPVLGRWNVSFERYEREDYGHFRLHGLHYANATIELTARQVRTVTPLVWLAQRWRGGEPVISAEDWRLGRSTGVTPAAGGKPVSGLPDLRAVLQPLGPRLAFWLPWARLSGGVVRDFGPDLVIAQAEWRGGALKVDGLRVAGQGLAFVLTPGADGSVTLAARTAENDAHLRLVWSDAGIQGEARLWDQPLQLAARFPAQGWIPTEASAVAKDWRLPAARVKLGAPYAQVQGDARLDWRDGKFDLSINAKAEPDAATKTKAPPFEAAATAHGNLRELTLASLQLDAPFVTARLTAPITFSFDHPLPAGSARLVVQADLAKLPWLEARGKVEGTVTVTGDRTAARQDFEFKFSDLVVENFSIKGAHVRGLLAWPRMELTELEAQLDDTSSLTAHGVVDWRTRELAGVAFAAKLGPAWFARWLPAGATWSTAEATGSAEGPLAAPRHQGSLKLTGAQRPPVLPLDVAVSWQGAGARLEISARAQAKESAVDLAGTLGSGSLQLTKLQFAPGGQAVWQLAAPARIAWSPVWRVENLHLSGPDSELTFSGHGGPDGLMEIATTRFESAWLQDWVTLGGPGWQMHSLQVTGHVAERAVVFATMLTAQIAMSPHPAQVKLVASGDAHGLEIKELKVVENERVLTQATGRLPLSWVLEPEPHLSIDEGAPLELSASTEPDSPLWATLSAYTGLQLTTPAAKIELKGTLRQPVGELQANVARLEATPGRFKFSLPEFDDLALAVQFGRDLITVTNFSAKLDGQAVQASGRLPMDDVRWRQLWQAPAAIDWSKAGARLEIPDADLAPMARRFPGFFAAQGRLRASVELAPGGKFSGELQLTGAATRPVPPFGTLQDIKGGLVLAGRTITVQSLTALLGGEPVTVDGSVTLVPDGPPRLALNLKGQNLPLVRTTGLLVRSDLDLHATTTAAGVTRLSGAVTVRDCLVLANVNLRTLLPTGRHGVTLQPPYFAVAVEPFRHWPLAVEVRAPEAIRVRTTVYNGTASAHFQLAGTLGEPRAVGELTVDQGQVLFPFATFKVTQGAVRLREADPFHAIVSLNATSQRRDYQMRLEMTGELPAPNVIITSTPALEAADVLLMVMTGQAPVTTTAGTVASSGQRLALLGAYLGRGLFQDLGIGGEDRLEVSSGEHVSRQGRETYEIEYKLGERWSLQGEYDQFDAYNAGLKWHVYTEEGAPLEKK